MAASSAGTYTPQWDASGTYSATSVSFKAVTSGGGTPLNACDLAPPFGTIDSADVTLAVNMAIGNAACTANVEGALQCTVITVQRIVNALLGQGCVTYTGGGTSHSATLSWTASTSSGVAGYNVYRSTTSGGPYTKMNPSPIAIVTYTDTAVSAGLTYYYVLTSVDVSGNESAYSTQASGVIPAP